MKDIRENLNRTSRHVKGNTTAEMPYFDINKCQFTGLNHSLTKRLECEGISTSLPLTYPPLKNISSRLKHSKIN